MPAIPVDGKAVFPLEVHDRLFRLHTENAVDLAEIIAPVFELLLDLAHLVAARALFGEDVGRLPHARGEDPQGDQQQKGEGKRDGADEQHRPRIGAVFFRHDENLLAGTETSAPRLVAVCAPRAGICVRGRKKGRGKRPRRGFYGKFAIFEKNFDKPVDIPVVLWYYNKAVPCVTSTIWTAQHLEK